MERRDFLRSAVAGLAVSASEADAAQQAPASAGKKVIAIQIGAVSFMDEGVEKVLDILQEKAGITPRAYADFCRLESFKGGLREGRSVTTALYDAGYGSSSRLYERAASQLGMTPTAYRRGGAGLNIRYDILDTPAGTLLVGATSKGVCAIQFGGSAKKLEESVREEFPAADLHRDPWFLSPGAGQPRAHLDVRLQTLDVPLDIQATAFQRRVWEYLQTIPYGSTQSYGEIAKRIRQPRAARAVARACASNPVAVVIPCHRVVRGDGETGGYRWGAERKRKLLRMEKNTV